MTDKKSIVFLDRDGVINKKPLEHEYVKNINEFFFNPGIFKVLKFLRQKGFEFIVFTNQRGIARGLMTENDLHKINQFMIEGLRRKAINLLDIFYCPHNKDSCQCRKPGPGLMLQALAKYNIDLSQSLMIGDGVSDAVFAKLFKLKFFLINSNRPEEFLKHYANE